MLLQILLLTTFLYFFGLPAITRFVRKEVMVVETSKETNGVPFPAITISVVDQIKNNSCFGGNVSVADCLEKVTLNRSDVLKSVILGWSKRQEIVIDRENMREDFTSVFPGIYFTLDLPINIGPNDYNDQLFLSLNTNLTYVVFVHDPDYFMFNVNPVAIPAASNKFTTHKKEPNKFYYRMDLVEVNNLNRQHKPCKEDPEYSFLACLRKSIALKVIFIAFSLFLAIFSLESTYYHRIQVGCRTKWDIWSDQGLPLCSSGDQFRQI